MTDGNYGKADSNRKSSVTGTEIHVNRDFIGSRDQWFPVADLINNLQPSVNLEMYNNVSMGLFCSAVLIVLRGRVY